VLNIEIRRPRIEDTNELNLFFEKVIIDTFTKEGIGEKFEDIEAEIESKKKYLVSDFASMAFRQNRGLHRIRSG
jgi:hypothetical protein